MHTLYDALSDRHVSAKLQQVAQARHRDVGMAMTEYRGVLQWTRWIKDASKRLPVCEMEEGYRFRAQRKNIAMLHLREHYSGFAPSAKHLQRLNEMRAANARNGFDCYPATMITCAYDDGLGVLAYQLPHDVGVEDILPSIADSLRIDRCSYMMGSKIPRCSLEHCQETFLAHGFPVARAFLPYSGTAEIDGLRSIVLAQNFNGTFFDWDTPRRKLYQPTA